MFWMVNVCAEILCISSLAIFPAVSQNWANSASMELHWTHTLLPRLFYLLSSEFPCYHFIINFSIIQSWGAEPTCNLGENREVWACGYIVYNFAISKIYSNVPPTVHVLPTFIIPFLLETFIRQPCYGMEQSNCIISSTVCIHPQHQMAASFPRIPLDVIIFNTNMLRCRKWSSGIRWKVHVECRPMGGEEICVSTNGSRAGREPTWSSEWN